MSVYRKKLAVRRLEQAVRILFRADGSSLSGHQNGRLAVQLRRSISRLKRLLRDDPDDDFWDILQQSILKIVRYLRRP
jgi:ABC-type uncharacterized transport system YnjBCD ATPase subunit